VLAALSAEKTPALREHVLKNFVWKVVAEKTAVVYRNVVHV
jgi:hypothetical protein